VRDVRAAVAASGSSSPAARLSSAAAFPGGEPEVGRAQLGKLCARAQPRQAERRVGAAGQHQVQPRRQVLDQERHRLVHAKRADQVVVVEEQQDLLAGGLSGYFVDHCGHHTAERPRRGRPEQRGYPCGDPATDLVQRCGGVPPEPHRVVVTRVQ
jgi:hypothetical protein